MGAHPAADGLRRRSVLVVALVVQLRSCRIEIADRGIGIPDAQRDEIFNAFTRADGSERYPGTGLGLAIVQRIVNRHGGTVGIEANPGGGSRFWFTLPPTAPLSAERPDLVG